MYNKHLISYKVDKIIFIVNGAECQHFTIYLFLKYKIWNYDESQREGGKGQEEIN